MATRIEAFPADPALPQLRIASDPERMREVFQRHLRPLDGKAYDIQDCLLWRLRYRRATRCILQYRLRLVEPTTGREWNQWVTAEIYADDSARRSWEELRGADPGQEIPPAFQTFEPVAFISHLGMLIQVYPYDRQLPALPALLGGGGTPCSRLARAVASAGGTTPPGPPPWPPPALAETLLAQLGPGDWHAEAWSIEPICYRAGLAAVVRYGLQARDATTGRRDERRFYAKVCRDGEGGERAFSVLQALHASAPSAGEGFTVGKPIAYLTDLRTLLQEEVKGHSLEELMLRGGDTRAADGPLPAVRKVARAVAAFNQSHLATPQPLLLHDQVTRLKRVGRLLQWACPHLGEEVETIVGAVAPHLEAVSTGPTHRDLKADHFLLEGDRLALLDLDLLVEADPVLDPATLLAQFASMPFRFPLSHDQARTVARVFAEEYFAHVPPAWRRRLPFHYADAVLHVAVGFFRRHRPRWRETVATLVEEARASLAGGVW
jgi:hypothetical protein